jgi:hypothetical protein
MESDWLSQYILCMEFNRADLISGSDIFNKIDPTSIIFKDLFCNK